ncbi:unnamed protein product [Enterobius vermicularis]|uniref:Uncharacterized protein n=1 Tax=Enterobius vermicularis TaxID=51028 RepID=A0A0N4V5R0_ENTVE|nr:unnamed protein product [Enterobius vermicularis]
MNDSVPASQLERTRQDCYQFGHVILRGAEMESEEREAEKEGGSGVEERGWKGDWVKGVVRRRLLARGRSISAKTTGQLLLLHVSIFGGSVKQEAKVV